MSLSRNDPLVRKALADALMERLAEELRQVLQEAVGELDPFPSFQGSPYIQALEAEPPRSGGGDRGCVVVCPDGQLYEMNIRLIPSVGGVGMTTEPMEELKELDLEPVDYIPYAYNAIKAITEILEERRKGKS